MIEITCGLKTSYDQNGTLENLMLLGFPKTTSEGIYFSWAIPSLWYSENSEADQRISFHNRIISKVRPVERIIEVTENFATILGISLLHLNNRTIKKMDKISTKGTLFYDSFEMFYDVIGDPLLLYKVQDKDGQWWNADEWDKKIEEYHLSCCPSCETDDFVEILYSDGVLNLRHCKDCELNF